MKNFIVLILLGILSVAPLEAQIALEASQEGVSRKEIQTIRGEKILIQRRSQLRGPDNGDINLQKFDKSGNLMWSRYYGGSGYEYVGTFTQTRDGGFLIIGTTSSFGNGNNDIYLIKADSEGNEIWSRTYGGFFNEYGKFLKELSNGNIILKGQQQYCDGENVGSNCRDQEWIFEVDPFGNPLVSNF